ncbi:MAG: hypothetical protein ABI946_03705 [Chthoniobacterales bacterium]
MKLKNVAGGIVLPALGLFLAAGCTTSQPLARNHTLNQDNTERVAFVTGSNVPQKVRVKSIGTDTAQNVRIVTQEELIQTNGGFGVGGISTYTR